MFDRFSSIRDVLIRLCLGVFVFVVSGCGTPPPTATNNANPQITPTCPSPSTNPYRQYQNPSQVTNIFLNYKRDLAIYDNVRQDAFIQLSKHVKQWSDYEDMTIDGRIVRITITYLDPMLVQFAILNEALVPPNNSMDQSWFESQIQTAMTKLASRDEIMFIVTITSQFNESALFVDFPIADLELISTSGIKALPTHYDPILGKHNDVSKKHLYGFVSYPVSLLLQGNCAGIVDLWTTSLTLDHDESLTQEDLFYNLFWNISYQPPVVLQGNTRPVPTLDPYLDKNRYSKSPIPPSPDVLADDKSSNFYWEEMGRYIWNRVVTMDYK